MLRFCDNKRLSTQLNEYYLDIMYQHNRLKYTDLTRSCSVVMTPRVEGLKTLFVRALYGFLWWYRFAFFSFSSLATVVFKFIWTNDLGNVPVK